MAAQVYYTHHLKVILDTTIDENLISITVFLRGQGRLTLFMYGR